MARAHVCRHVARAVRAPRSRALCCARAARARRSAHCQWSIRCVTHKTVLRPCAGRSLTHKKKVAPSTARPAACRCIPCKFQSVVSSPSQSPTTLLEDLRSSAVSRSRSSEARRRALCQCTRRMPPARARRVCRRWWCLQNHGSIRPRMRLASLRRQLLPASRSRKCCRRLLVISRWATRRLSQVTSAQVSACIKW